MVKGMRCGASLPINCARRKDEMGDRHCDDMRGKAVLYQLVERDVLDNFPELETASIIAEEARDGDVEAHIQVGLQVL